MNKIYLLYGNDLLLISEQVSEIKNNTDKLNNQCVGVEYHELQNPDDLEKFLSHEHNLSLFSENLVLQIQLNLKIILHLQKDLDSFKNYITQLSKNKTIVFVLYMEKYDQATKSQLYESVFFNAFKKFAIVEEYVKLSLWKTNEIKTKISKLAAKYDLVFEEDALNLFIECFKNSLDSLHQELQKLQTYLLPNNLITKQIVSDLYDVAVNVDNLYEFVINKKYAAISKIIYKLNIIQLPLYLVAALQNKFRQALHLKLYLRMHMNHNQVFKLTGISPYKIQKDIIKIKNIDLKYLKYLVCILSNLEYQVKSGLVGDRHALDMIVLRSSC